MFGTSERHLIFHQININFSSWWLLYRLLVACWETLLGSCGFIEVKTLPKGCNLTPFSNFQHLCTIYHISLKKKEYFSELYQMSTLSCQFTNHRVLNCFHIFPMLTKLIDFVCFDSSSLCYQRSTNLGRKAFPCLI